MTRHSPRPKPGVSGRSADDADRPKGMLDIGSQVALIAAGVVAVIGAGLVIVLVAGLLDGVRGIGPVLLGGLAVGVFALAGRLAVVARSMKAPTSRRRPRPRRYKV